MNHDTFLPKKIVYDGSDAWEYISIMVKGEDSVLFRLW